MPDDVRDDFLSDKHHQGIERLERFLNESCSKKPIRLSERQVAKYKGRGAVAGWAIQPPGVSRRLIIFVDNRYPFSIPKTAVEPPPAPLTYPHVEADGYLCLAEGAVPKDESAIEDVARLIVAESVELINACVSGESQQDFLDEILSYWDRAKSENAAKGYSLLDLDKEPTARKVLFWKGIDDEKSVLIADELEEGEQWLNNKQGKPLKRNPVEGLFVWSDKILLPSEYPENNKQVCDLLKDHCGNGAFKIFQELAGKTPNYIDMVIGFSTDTGNALVGITLERPYVSSSYRMTSKQELTKGFRPGFVNPAIAANRYASTKAVSNRYNIQRVDPSWALSRDSDVRIKTLKNKTVTIVGCGSIGSEVARMLAQNGVGAFNLIDPDTMDWENIGRHALGAEAITLKKPIGKVFLLEQMLTAQFPHLKFRSRYSAKWEDVLIHNPAVLHDADLIIMATGDWPAENAMNKYRLAQDNFPPVLFGWAEAFAAAGHSFAVLDEGGCFNCAFEETSFRFKLTEFANEERRLPTCGGVFQPFRSIELASINAIIAAHAVDVLMGQVTTSQIRSWLGSQSVLDANDGEWTDIASTIIQTRGAVSGQFLIELDFEKIPTCHACSNEEAVCDTETKPVSELPLKTKS